MLLAKGSVKSMSCGSLSLPVFHLVGAHSQVPSLHCIALPCLEAFVCLRLWPTDVRVRAIGEEKTILEKKPTLRCVCLHLSSREAVGRVEPVREGVPAGAIYKYLTPLP